MEENENDSLSAVERHYPEWITTLENQLKKSEGAKVDQEILRTLLMKLLLSPTMTVARALCQSLVSSSHDYESVCNSLLIIFRHNNQDMRLVEWALQNEIDTCEGGTTATLFRGMTVGVKLVSIYLHIKGHFFLKGVLQPLIAQMQTTSAIEVDPMKLADLTQLQDNQKRLMDSVEQMFLAMESAIDLFPCTLRRVFQKAHQMVEERFNEKGYQLIGGFFFLRFVCPALVSPERVGLASSLSNETRRSLILISKVLQNASNDVQFGEKEQYMVFINEWIALKQERMQRFLSALSTAPSDADAHPAPPGTEKMSTEEDRRMAVRALVNSFDTHKEQMSAALAGHKEQLLFDRLIQVVDPADLLAVENVTLNFTKVFRTSLGEIDVKRTPDAYGGRRNKDRKKEKDKEKEGKEKRKWNSREDIKVVGKGRWRRLNRPVSDFIHHEELASFSNAMRHATTTEATKTLESQIAVLKEQLAAEREVRSKVETQLAIARSHLAQEAARREGVERLAGAMLEKLKSAGIAFNPPAPAPSSPTPAAASHSNHHPIPTLSSSPPSPAPSGAKSTPQVYALSRHNSSPHRLVSKAPPTGGATQQQGTGGTSSPPHSLSPLSQTKAPHTSPREQHAKVSPRSTSRQSTSVPTASGQQQSSSITTATAGSVSAPSNAVPRVRQSSGGGSLIASAYQNSGRPLMAVDDAQSGKSLTDRLVDKMFSADSGLELRETRDGRLCFCGCECVDWLVEELRVGRDKAVVIGDKLLQRGFFRCLVYDTASFTDDHTLFQATTPTADSCGED